MDDSSPKASSGEALTTNDLPIWLPKPADKPVTIRLLPPTKPITPYQFTRVHHVAAVCPCPICDAKRAAGVEEPKVKQKKWRSIDDE